MLSHLLRYRLRSSVTVADVTASWAHHACVSGSGPAAESSAAAASNALPLPSSVRACADPRSLALGSRLLMPCGTACMFRECLISLSLTLCCCGPFAVSHGQRSFCYFLSSFLCFLYPLFPCSVVGLSVVFSLICVCFGHVRSVPPAWQTLPELSFETFEAWRMLHGVMDAAVDATPGDTIPLEHNLAWQHGISFDKGCYLGQELMARTQFKGVIRKRVVPVVFSGSDVDSTASLVLTPAASLISSSPALRLGPHSMEPSHAQLSPAVGDASGDTRRVVSDGTGRAVGVLLATAHNVGLVLLRLADVDAQAVPPTLPARVWLAAGPGADGGRAALPVQVVRPGYWPTA